MRSSEVKSLIDNYITEEITFSVEFSFLNAVDGRAKYNELIRKKIAEKKTGVYLWVNAKNDEIIYIGMAGKIKSLGRANNHFLRNRLTASRGKSKISKLDILTNDFLKIKMEELKINKLNFHIFFTKLNEPPSYVEAMLLYKFYKHNNHKLPILNNSF